MKVVQKQEVQLKINWWTAISLPWLMSSPNIFTIALLSSFTFSTSLSQMKIFFKDVASPCLFKNVSTASIMYSVACFAGYWNLPTPRTGIANESYWRLWASSRHVKTGFCSFLLSFESSPVRVERTAWNMALHDSLPALVKTTSPISNNDLTCLIAFNSRWTSGPP